MSRGRLPKLLPILIASLTLFAGCEHRIRESSAGVAATAAAARPGAAAVPLPNFSALVKSQGPAVVNISNTRKQKGAGANPYPHGLTPDDPLFELLKRFGGNAAPHEFRSQSVGSGFIIDHNGHILTNSHVVEDADEVVVGLTDKREFKAKVIGVDQRTDIALLKISASNLPVVGIGDPAKLQVGEWVIAIGAPFGFLNSVTQGIVSAKGRDLPGQDIVPFIQTDVAINPGNSGGPLFNMQGEVIGINSQIYSRSGGSMGISFAIPIDVAMKVKDQLLQHGAVRRGRMGVSIQNVNQELAKSFGLAKAAGALIAAVEKDGPADRAGLQSGDVVLQFAGRDVSSSAELTRLVSEAAPGANVMLRIWRSGAARDVLVSVGELDAVATRKEPGTGGPEPVKLGLTLRELSGAERQSHKTEGTVIVEAVEGIAAAVGIEPDDIILAINHHPVSSIEQLRTEMEKSRKRVALLIERNADTRLYISLSLTDDQGNDMMSSRRQEQGWGQ